MTEFIRPLALVVATCAACTGGVTAATDVVDASLEASADGSESFDASGQESAVPDGDILDGGWTDPPSDAVAWQYADVKGFADYEAPVPGEFPPSPGYPCAHGGTCEPYAGCDPYTGWCCSGKFKSWGCGCGDTYGCAAPAVCCAFPDATANTCVPTSTACPTPPP